MIGNRPISFFGPDCDDPENWQDERCRIVEAQLYWDEQFLSLPWYKQLISRLQGEVTEPVNTSEGMPMDSMVKWCLKYLMENLKND